MNNEIIAAVALGIGLSASAGFRVFIPLLVASIAARSGILPLNESFAWMGSWAALICFGTASVVEILAYYIPFIDNLLDSITTPLALGAGTLLMTSVLPVDSDLLKWVTGIIVGGGMATTVQAGSVLTRLASSKFTAGFGNVALSTAENTASAGFSVMSLFVPVIIAVFFLLFVIWIFSKLGKKIFHRSRV